MHDIRKREIRSKAEEFYRGCKVVRYGIMDLFEECNRCGYKLIRHPLGENADLGFCTKKDNDTIIFTNSSMRLSREIFTLAHEIGHIILHFNQETVFVDNNYTIVGVSKDIKEQEANLFAACLLLPKTVVNNFFDLELPDINKDNISAYDIAKIMSEFNVSFEVVLNRLEDLDIIDNKAKMRLDNAKNQIRVGNLLKSAGVDRRLNEVSEEITVPLEYLDYVIYNYNHKAIPKETLLRALECYNLMIEDISEKIVEQSEDDIDFDDLIRRMED